MHITVNDTDFGKPKVTHKPLHKQDASGSTVDHLTRLDTCLATHGEGAWATLEALLKCSLRVREYFITVSFLHRNIAMFKRAWQRKLWIKPEVHVNCGQPHGQSFSWTDTLPVLPCGHIGFSSLAEQVLSASHYIGHTPPPMLAGRQVHEYHLNPKTKASPRASEDSRYQSLVTTNGIKLPSVIIFTLRKLGPSMLAHAFNNNTECSTGRSKRSLCSSFRPAWST